MGCEFQGITPAALGHSDFTAMLAWPRKRREVQPASSAKILNMTHYGRIPSHHAAGTSVCDPPRKLFRGTANRTGHALPLAPAGCCGIWLGVDLHGEKRGAAATEGRAVAGARRELGTGEADLDGG